MLSADEIKKELSGILNEKRYRHTLGVANTAVSMAEFYGVDAEKAEIAALLHDSSRALSEEEMRELAGKTLFPDKYPFELTGKELYHSIASEVLAREKYGVTDTDILSAIRWHTTGKADMTALEMVVYSADMIEPTREYDGVEDLRLLQDKGLKYLTFMCCKHTAEYLRSSGKHIHGSTLELYNDLKNTVKGE